MSEAIADAGNTQPTGEAQQAVTAAAPAVVEAASTQQATASQPAAPAEPPAAASTEGKGAEAPAAYELKAPEGARTIDAAAVAKVTAVAKELGLTQEAAQKVIDTLSATIDSNRGEAEKATVTKFASDMAALTRADKEIGGDKLTENLATAEKALDAFGTPELRALLTATGLANHPDVVRMFLRVGKAISEDKFVQGGRAPTKGETSLANRLYPQKSA